MAERKLVGTKRKNKFVEGLRPVTLHKELIGYQYKFGKEFDLANLLLLKEIESRALVAEAIGNLKQN